MRTLCDAYYEEHESHYRAFLDLSAMDGTCNTHVWFSDGIQI